MNGTTISTLSKSEFNTLTSDLDDTKLMITAEEQSPSAHAYQKENYLICNNNLYKVISAIEICDTLLSDTNIEQVTVEEGLEATVGGVITPPTLTSATSFVYDGTSKSLSFSRYDEDSMVMGGESEIWGGQYAAAIALKNVNNTWSDINDAKLKNNIIYYNSKVSF